MRPARLAAAAIWAVFGACAANAQSFESGAPVARSGRIRHVVLRGDFEAMAPVSKLGEELERTARDGDVLVILEMDGDRGRCDVALALVEVVRASRTPVAAYLADGGDHRVGAAQACVSLVAAERVMDPGTVVRAAAGDDLAELAALGSSDAERTSRELSGVVYARLAEADAPKDLATALVPVPGEPWPRDAWAIIPVAGAGGPTVVFEDPASSLEGGSVAARLTDRAASGGVVLTLSAERMKQLGIAKGLSRSAGGVPAAVMATGVIRGRTTIDFTLGGPRRSVEADLRDVDDLLRRATDDLDLPKPPRRDISPDLYRRAAASARDRISAAQGLLERSEAVVAEYPELTRTPAPGQTGVAGTASAYAAKWRAAFQSRSDRASKLEDKATAFDSGGRD